MHSQIFINTFTHSYSHMTFTHTHIHTQTHTHSHIHIFTHWHTNSQCHSPTHIHIHSHTHSHSHTLIITYTHRYTHSHITHTVTIPCTHTLIHTHSCTVTHWITYTQIYTFTHVHHNTVTPIIPCTQTHTPTPYPSYFGTPLPCWATPGFQTKPQADLRKRKGSLGYEPPVTVIIYYTWSLIGQIGLNKYLAGRSCPDCEHQRSVTDSTMLLASGPNSVAAPPALLSGCRPWEAQKKTFLWCCLSENLEIFKQIHVHEKEAFQCKMHYVLDVSPSCPVPTPCSYLEDGLGVLVSWQQVTE